MKRNKVREFFGSRRVLRTGCVLLAAAVLGTGAFTYQFGQSNMPELTTFVDTDDQIVIGEEEVPLASAPKVQTSTQKTKKVVKLKKKSKRTYTKKLKPKKTTSPMVTKTSGDTVTTVKKEITTNVTEKYKKNSNRKTVITVKKTKTTTTNTQRDNSTPNVNQTVSGTQTGASPYVSTTPYTVSVAALAPKVDSRVMSAYQQLGFDITIDPKASYAGYFNARNQNITLREESDTIYHELGHFLAFAAGNVDTKPEFSSIYQTEKNSFTGSRKAYASQNSSEFFAEAFREYTVNPGALKSSCPGTFQAITDALAKVTDNQVSQIKAFYGAIWTK